MNSRRFILTAGLLLGTALATFAAPPSQRTTPAPALRTTEEFAQLKEGDKIALVCKQCDTVTTKTLASKDEAMALCAEGSTIMCPSCNESYKIVSHGPRSKGGTHRELRYVNDKGEECLFVTKVND